MLTLILAIVLALVYGYLNGFNNASAVVATIISSRAMSPRLALTLTAVTEFCAPFLFGVAVARTVASGIVIPQQVTLLVMMAAMLGAILWGRVTWFLGIPSSSSHALIGGLIGSVIVSVGLQGINFSGLLTVLLVLFASPVIGLVAGFVMTKCIYYLTRHASMRINWFFKKAQIVTGAILGLSFGHNDAQKTIGLITMALIVSGRIPDFTVPLWVMFASAAAVSLGVSGGGWRLIRTLGGKFYKIRPVHGFAAQLSAAGVVLLAAWMGGPVSVNQVISSAILGVGSAERVSKVRWGIAGQTAMTWVITIPFSAVFSALLYYLLQAIF